jgi:uncharacterized protein (UPF0147 family)
VDINSLTNTQPLLTPNAGVENSLNLKVGQQLDVKVIGAEIEMVKNAITLSLGDKNITVISNQSVTLESGQNLKIQVMQITPVIAFKVLNTLPELKAPVADLRLTLLSTAKDGGSVANGREPMRSIAKDGGSNAKGVPSSLSHSSLDAKIISIVGNKIQMQISNASSEIGNKQVSVINIDRSQLTNPPSDIKVGQNLNLQIIKTGTKPEFRIIPEVSLPEAKLTEYIKQFLPRHEASPIFLNQLIKDLPQLMKNPSVPEVLKDMAEKIIQNLPPKEQLISSSGLKQAIANSGLFLEAKLSAQFDLISTLPQMIKNESVPQSLQRVAAEILQNLTQKPALLNSPLADVKLMPDAVLESQQLNNTPKTNNLGAADFKANILNFIQTLKQELNTQEAQQYNQVDLDMLKNLQNKTENTVAKIVLDQLMSLPKEDNSRDLWIIDIPFMDRQQAESVRIEVQRDKENKQEYSSDWSVNITITPPELGTIHCLVSYRNNLISSFFKSQNGQTTQLIKHNLDYLKNQLEASGLTIGHLDAHAETQKKLEPYQLAGQKLFDDKA